MTFQVAAMFGSYVWKSHYGGARLLYSSFSFKTSNNPNQGLSRLRISAREEGLAGRENTVLGWLTRTLRRPF